MIGGGAVSIGGRFMGVTSGGTLYAGGSAGGVVVSGFASGVGVGAGETAVVLSPLPPQPTTDPPIRARFRISKTFRMGGIPPGTSDRGLSCTHPNAQLQGRPEIGIASEPGVLLLQLDLEQPPS